MMFNNLSEKDILDVFLESDTDEEEDCLIVDEKVSRKDSSKFLEDLNNLDFDEETCFGENFKQFEGEAEINPKCVNISGKNVVDLTSIKTSADSKEIQRGYMVRQIGETLDLRYICLDCGNHYSHKGDIYNHRILKFRKKSKHGRN